MTVEGTDHMLESSRGFTRTQLLHSHLPSLSEEDELRSSMSVVSDNKPAMSDFGKRTTSPAGEEVEIMIDNHEGASLFPGFECLSLPKLWTKNENQSATLGRIESEEGKLELRTASKYSF